MMGAKPFLKWAGGKGRLLPEIRKFYPSPADRQINFDILNGRNFKPREIYISDANFELVNAYRILRDNVEELVAALKIMDDEFRSQFVDRKSYFLNKRNRFNKLMTVKKYGIEKAALFIFLNKTCYNGLYRVNSKGLFNVAFGRYKNPVICDEKNLLAAHEKLQHVKISYGSYQVADDFIDEKTFVYFDPSYRPITTTANFTSYTKERFDDADQIKLASFVNRVCQRGARIVLSNSDSGDGFFDWIYSLYNIERVYVQRNISCKERKHIIELLISNVNSVDIFPGGGGDR